MTSTAAKFNRSAFGRWINSSAGRVFRLVAGIGFAAFGIFNWGTLPGTVALIWSVLPLSAGLLDMCWISGSLGGPFRGEGCRRLGADA